MTNHLAACLVNLNFELPSCLLHNTHPGPGPLRLLHPSTLQNSLFWHWLPLSLLLNSVGDYLILLFSLYTSYDGMVDWTLNIKKRDDFLPDIRLRPGHCRTCFTEYLNINNGPGKCLHYCSYWGLPASIQSIYTKDWPLPVQHWYQTLINILAKLHNKYSLMHSIYMR